MKSVGPKLVPFFKTCTIFFVLFADTPASETSAPWFFCIIKCLPIISLILFVLLNGMNITEYYRYSRRVLIGLIFSCLGDACLVWKKYFEVGVGCFAIAQICYARAFGWKPLNLYAGAVFAALGVVVYLFLSVALKGIMLYMVAAYVGVICTMGWRAVARIPTFNFFDDQVTWTQMSGCFGALAFVTSDLVLAVDKFIMPLPYAHPIIMVTYYAAQFGIALSVVDSQVDAFIATLKQKQGRIESEQMNGQLRDCEIDGHISDSEINGDCDKPVSSRDNMLIHRNTHTEIST